MARTKKQKKDLVQNYLERIEKSKAFFVLEPNKLKANQAVEIKKNLNQLNAQYNVVKNSLFVLALKEAGIDITKDEFINPKSIVFSDDQISESAKVINEFTKSNNESLSISFGFLGKTKISASKIKELAGLPPREVLLAQVLSTMQAPISGFVNVLAGNLRNIVYVLNAIKEQKQA